MKNAMDLFGRAVLAYSKGDKSPFYLIDDKGDKEELDLSKYFRGYSDFTELEKELIKNAKGRVLDVGCGTGNFMPYFSKDSVGIDISATMIKVAKNNNIKNCEVKDVFDYKPENKFDTIVFVENNLGMAETLEGTKKLLQKVKSLIEDSGQILTNAPKSDLDYFIYKVKPVWKDEVGEKFGWLSFGFEFLRKLSEEVGLVAEIISTTEKDNLIRIKKK